MRKLTAREIESYLDQIMKIEQYVRELKELKETGEKCLKNFGDPNHKLFIEGRERCLKDFGNRTISFQIEPHEVEEKDWDYNCGQRDSFESRIESLQKPIEMSEVIPKERPIKKPGLSDVKLTDEEEKRFSKKEDTFFKVVFGVLVFLVGIISYKMDLGVFITTLILFGTLFFIGIPLTDAYKGYLRKPWYDELMKKYKEEVERAEREKREEEIRLRDPEVIKRREEILREKNRQRSLELNAEKMRYTYYLKDNNYRSSDDNIRTLQELKDQISVLLQETMDILEKLYSLYIDERYRYYGAVCFMWKDFHDGRVVRFEGDGGAFNRIGTPNVGTSMEKPKVSMTFIWIYRFMIRVSANPLKCSFHSMDLWRTYSIKIKENNERTRKYIKELQS